MCQKVEQSKMREVLIEPSVEAMIKAGIIQESEKELYLFGIQGLVLLLVNLATTAAIGMLFGMLWQSFLFSAAYIPLRRYAGGYHAKTQARCYCLSVLLISGVLLMLKYVSFSAIAELIILAVSAAVIFVKAPVESVNKPLNVKEWRVFRLKARVILLTELAASVILMGVSQEIALCIIMAVGSSGMMLIAVRRKGKRRERSIQ